MVQTHHPRPRIIRLRLAALVLAGALSFLAALAWNGPGMATAQGGEGPNQPPILGPAPTFYDGALGTLPTSQAFVYLTNPPFNPQATQTVTAGGTLLDSSPTRLEHAGYFLSSAATPTFDRQQGYAVRFEAQLLSEAHVTPHRAGFSIIVLSSDTRGIELGFWEQEVWAQEGGSGASLFTHAEGVAFDTRAPGIIYELAVRGDRYRLAANGVPILQGPLRDYTAFSGFPDPYETPNLLFLGDDTTSAQARVVLRSVSAILPGPPPAQGTSGGADHPLPPLGVTDMEAGSAPLSLTLRVDVGTLTLSPTGVLSDATVQGNGSGALSILAPSERLNAALGVSGTLRYRSPADFQGIATLTISADDQDIAGSGGPQRVTITTPITVTPGGPPTLALAYALAPQRAIPGMPITYTLRLTNTGQGTASAAILDATPPAALAPPTTIATTHPLTPTGPSQWALAPLLPGARAEMTLTTTLLHPVEAPGPITPTVTIRIGGGVVASSQATFFALRCPDVAAPAGIDAGDIAAIAHRWGQTPQHPDWGAHYDLDGSGEISIVDIMIASHVWQRTCGAR